MYKYFILGLVVGLALFISGRIGSAGRQDKEIQRRDSLEREYKAELADATPVQIGLLSERQRLHSKLFKHYAQVRNNKKISDLIVQLDGKGKILDTGVFVGLGPVLQADTPKHYFSQLAWASDIVIRGKVTGKDSQITEDGCFVFTDYEVLITELIKNNASAPINNGSKITVTRPGGKVLLNDVIVRATDQLFIPLPDNHEVVLFLKFVPETGAYRATEAEGSFELDGSSLRPLTHGAFPPGVLRDAESLLATIHQVSK